VKGGRAIPPPLTLSLRSGGLLARVLMKILVIGNEELTILFKREGFITTNDPVDDIYAVVSTSQNHEMIPEEYPAYILCSGGISDWAARKARPDAVFFNSIEEIKHLLKQTKVEPMPEKSTKDSLIIATYANKGGVGKTTVANSLALTLAKEGINTVICDFDFGGANLAGFYNLKGVFGNYFDDNVMGYLTKVKNNLYLLPAPTNVIPNQIKGEHLENTLEQLREHFTVVLCDTCPSPWEKEYMGSVFNETDLVYAVVNQSKFSIEETKIYGPQLLYMGAEIGNIRIILNQYDPKLVSIKEVEKCFNSGFKKGVKKLPSIVAVIPHDWQEANKATYKGNVTNIDVWENVCQEIASKLNITLMAEAEQPKKTFMGFLKRR